MDTSSNEESRAGGSRPTSVGTPAGPSATSSAPCEGSRREAERELSRLLVEVDEGRHAAAAPVTFSELRDRWLDVKRRLVADGFAWTDPTDQRDPREVLEAEGVRFIDGVADPDQKLGTEDLLALVEDET